MAKYKKREKDYTKAQKQQMLEEAGRGVDPAIKKKWAKKMKYKEKGLMTSGKK